MDYSLTKILLTCHVYTETVAARKVVNAGYMSESEEDCHTSDILQALSNIDFPNLNLSDFAIRKRHDKERRRFLEVC